MNKLTLISALCFSILFSCSDENELKLTEGSLIGSWNYEKVLFNGEDISQLTPGFTVSNFLHLAEDHSAGKCYINGVWSIQDGSLKLQWTHDNISNVYKIVNVSNTTLTLQTELRQSEYGISLPQFGEDEVITITEQFVKMD